MITAQVVLINEEGLVLGVSRKDNHNDFGLPGGKMDPEDNGDTMATAIRECKEETGLDAYDLELVFAIHKSGNMGYTYLAKYKGEINHNEPHVVKWVPMQILINGSFGRYNELVSESLTSLGIKYQLDINEIELKEELDEFCKHNKLCWYNVSVDRIVKETTWLGKLRYVLYLNNIIEETLDFDERFLDGLERIGMKYGVEIKIPSYYYSK